LWKAADEFERKNGTAYREIEIALPRELTREQRIELVEDFVQKELGDRHAYQYAIHNPPGAIDGKEQPHAHIMFCERINDGIERDPQQFFKRANSKSPERGGAKKASIPQTAGERKAALGALRSRWAD
ncbi:MobA/MobL family protein, partial [Burkholderia cenocepacia]|uniref:MobA/MobL family protein n=1 Tax=Burkholderia cenocepacia TaxID=95486 RepID=UPI00159F12AD